MRPTWSARNWHYRANNTEINIEEAKTSRTVTDTQAKSKPLSGFLLRKARNGNWCASRDTAQIDAQEFA
jgi:hypothetical protein